MEAINNNTELGERLSSKPLILTSSSVQLETKVEPGTASSDEITLTFISPPCDLTSASSLPDDVTQPRESSTVDGDNNISFLTSSLSHEDDIEFNRRRKLCVVDPTVHFWTVDDELMGRFQVSSCTHSNQAMVFKIKTSSPYSFWAKPVYGLMKPNVVASVEIKCDPNVAPMRLYKEEFLVEVASVPLISTVMTSDLYTSSVATNLPNLVSIWDSIKASKKVEIEEHKVSCCLQRNKDKVELDKEGNQRQVPDKSFRNEEIQDGKDFYLARELLPAGKRIETGRDSPQHKKCSYFKDLFLGSFLVVMFLLVVYAMTLIFGIDVRGWFL